MGPIRKRPEGTPALKLATHRVCMDPRFRALRAEITATGQPQGGALAPETVTVETQSHGTWHQMHLELPLEAGGELVGSGTKLQAAVIRTPADVFDLRPLHKGSRINKCVARAGDSLAWAWEWDKMGCARARARAGRPESLSLPFPTARRRRLLPPQPRRHPCLR
jgi:hypothetical protein